MLVLTRPDLLRSSTFSAAQRGEIKFTNKNPLSSIESVAERNAGRVNFDHQHS